MFRVNVNLQQEVSGNDDQPCGPSHRGHTHVCLLCGCSTLHRQRDRILRDNPTELHQSVINIIESRVAPRQVRHNYELTHTIMPASRYTSRPRPWTSNCFTHDKPPLPLPHAPVSS